MFAHVTNLRYWKSERADITTCEDASRADPQRGLFCVADGAGTTLFSNIWADILVEQFVRDPLVGLDPFEMEWWIRQAQKRYRELAPQADKLNWNARQKAVEQGAYATLATLRFLYADEHSATAELLVVGDSCVIVGRPALEKISSFPLQHPTDFDRAPYCVPALLKNLNRKTLYARQLKVTLAPGDSIILATDAVARWIVNGGSSGQPDLAWQAFQEIASKQTEDAWRAFIDDCRLNQSMVDDDATALIIQLLADGQDEARLGSNAEASQETIQLRGREFTQAQAADNKELVAILYGDGQMLQNIGITLSADEKAHAQEVADAMRDLLQNMREAVKTAHFTARMEPIWWHYADLLSAEPCAETIRKTLASQGVRPKPALQPQFAPQPQLAPQAQFVPQPQPALQPQQVPQPQQASEHEALERLEHILQEGTPHQKVEAFHALSPDQLALTANDLLQLEIAQRLVEALNSHNEHQLCLAYDELEFSPLRKHFSFTPEDQQRIQNARSTRSAIQQLRAILHNDKKNASLLVDTYQFIRAPQSFLNDEEQRIIEVAQNFVRSTQDEQQTIHRGRNTRVHFYDELFFSPYSFTFSTSETQQIEQEREILRVARPPLALINNNTIDSTQFLALYTVKPLHAHSQISIFQKQLASERMEPQQFEIREHMDTWRKQIMPFYLPQSILDDLIRMTLINESISEESEESRRALEKKIQKLQDEAFKSIRARLAREERNALVSLGETQWRNALFPYAQYDVFSQHLQTISPGLTVESWFSERLRAATITYYTRPEASAPQTQDQRECWLFKWWFLRPRPLTQQQGENEHA